jgi:hypothetical protein
MTDRELIALMAAAVYPCVDADGSTLTDTQMAVQAARFILAEVDQQFEQHRAVQLHGVISDV